MGGKAYKPGDMFPSNLFLGFGSQVEHLGRRLCARICDPGFGSACCGPSCLHCREVGSIAVPSVSKPCSSTGTALFSCGNGDNGGYQNGHVHGNSVAKVGRTESGFEAEGRSLARGFEGSSTLFLKGSCHSRYLGSLLQWNRNLIYSCSSEFLGSGKPSHVSARGLFFSSTTSLAALRSSALTAGVDYESSYTDYSSCSETEDEDEHREPDDVDDVNGRAFHGDSAEARPRLIAPIRDLIAEAVERGYAKYNSGGLARATSNPKFVSAPDRSIVNHYSAVIRSIVNYYSFVNKRSSLWKVTSIYRKSCALTLARKHSLRSAQAAYNKFGPNLRISEPERDSVVLFYPESLKTTGKFIMSPRYSEVTILREPFDKKIRSWTSRA